MTEENKRRRLQGNLAEEYVKLELLKKGYRCCKLTERGYNKKRRKVFVYLNKEHLEYFIWDNFSGKESEKNNIMELIKENLVGLPDFICLKDNEISFIEVKSNHSRLRSSQKRVFPKIIRAGYTIKIFDLDIDLKINDLHEYEYKRKFVKKSVLKKYYRKSRFN